MRAQNTTNPSGKNYLDVVESDQFEVLTGFTLLQMKADQKSPVYSAPSTDAYEEGIITRDVGITDDPAVGRSSICTLQANTPVTYLTQFYGSETWAYIETTYQGQLLRGFIPANVVTVFEMDTIGK